MLPLISMFVSMEHRRIWCLSLPRQSMENLIWNSLLWSVDLRVVPRNPVLYQLKLNIHQNGRNQLIWWFLSAPGVCLHPYLILNLGTLCNYDGQSLYAPINLSTVQFSSLQSLSRVRLFAAPWIAACQASLSITNSRSSLILNVHRVGDAIQPSNPLSSPFPPAPNPSQHQSLFQWVNPSHEVAKVLEFQL